MYGGRSLSLRGREMCSDAPLLPSSVFSDASYFDVSNKGKFRVFLRIFDVLKGYVPQETHNGMPCKKLRVKTFLFGNTVPVKRDWYEPVCKAR